jgi:PTH1 family peptidyl-tRNA hydrolase
MQTLTQTSGIQLIVGLANPGSEYAHTRHNAGSWFVNNLADDQNISLRLNPKFHGLHGIAKIDGRDCHLLIPTTYMNLSGQAVQAISSYYKIPPQAILVVHDEIDLPIATVRLKFAGGHGGHNGLRDIANHLSTKDFYRLRVGVGHPGNSDLVVDYVLSPPKKDERQKIDDALRDAESILPFIMKGDFQKAMQSLHSEQPRE